MRFLDIMAIIGVVISLLTYFDVKPAVLRRFFTRRGKVLSWYAYLFVATVFSLLLALALVYLPIATGVVNMGILITDVMLGWVLVGLWSPALRRLHNKKLDRVLDIAYVSLFVFMLSAFWFVRWPEWQTPTLVTSFVALLLVVYLIDKFVRERHRRNAPGNQR